MIIFAFFIFFCFIAYLFLGVHVFLLNRKSETNRLFLAICISAGIWAFTYAFMLPAPDSQHALFWIRLSAIGWGTIYGFIIHFFLILTKQKIFRAKALMLATIYLPIVIFLYIFTSEAWTSSGSVAKISIGWVFQNPPASIWPTLFIIYYFIIILCSIILIRGWGKNSEFNHQKIQSRIIGYTLLAALGLGFICDALLPWLDVDFFSPLTAAVPLIPMIGIWVAINKYRFLTLAGNVPSSEILKNMNEGIVLSNLQGKFYWANQSALKILNASERDLIGKPLSLIFPDIGFIFPVSAHSASSNSFPYNTVYTLQQPSTTPKHLQIEANLHYDEWGDCVGLICAFSDISEKVSAGKILEIERAYFKNLFDLAPVGIIILDLNDRVVDCNQEFTHLFQFTKDECINKEINTLIVPDDLSEEASKLSNSVAGGQAIYQETIRKRKDGSILDVAIAGKPISLADGPGLIFGIYQDLTAKKSAEAEYIQRLSFQECIIGIASRFVTITDLDLAINDSLADIGRQSMADRSYLFLHDSVHNTITNTHEWCAPGIVPQKDSLQQLPTEAFPWLTAKIMNNEPIIIQDVAAMPPEAEAEKETLKAQEIRSAVIIPTRLGEKIAGFIGLDFVKDYMTQSDNAMAILKIASDIFVQAIERHRVEKMLMQEQDLFQMLLDNIPDSIYFKDTFSRFTKINKAQAELLGISDPTEAVGKTDFDFFDKGHSQKAFDDEQLIFNSGIPLIRSAENFQIGGKSHWMLATKVPIRNSQGSIVGIVGLSSNVTELKRAEEALRNSESFLLHLSELTNFALESHSFPNLFQVLADHINSLLSSDISFITLWDEESKTVTPVAISGPGSNSYQALKILPDEPTLTESVMQAGKPIVVEDLFNTPYVSHRIAQLFPTRSMLALPLIAGEKKLGAVLIGFTQTHHFTKEEIENGKIAANQIALLISKHKLLEQLTQQEKNLVNLNAEKDKLFSIIAHDLRGPIASFLSLTELMADTTTQFSGDEFRELSQAMHKSAAGLLRLLENLLEWSRLQRGMIAVRLMALNLSETISSSFDSLRDLASSKDLKVSIQVSPDLEIFADSQMMHSLISNLLSNAFKFTKNGGEITVSATKTDDGMVQCEVADSGVGITQDRLSNLFRIEAISPTRGTNGESSSGLGLLLCKEFVEKQNGKIWAESKLGIGSKFTFQIPANGSARSIHTKPTSNPENINTLSGQ